MAPSNLEREAKQARTRLRDYQARQSLNTKQVKRRVRDNIIAIAVGVVVIAAAATTQVLVLGPTAGTTASDPVASATPAPQVSAPPLPSPDLAEDREWTGAMTLSGVELGISLDGTKAPQAVASFISLSTSGFYNNLNCHRLTNGGFSVLQCGDPAGDGSGGPGYNYGPIENAPEDDVYPAGTIAMARVGGDAESQGSQFFIVYEDTTIPSDEAGGYTVIGKVTSGLNTLISDLVSLGTVDGSSDGAPATSIVIESVSVQ